MAFEREIPYCTLILVAGALACHIAVLMGNLATSSAMADMGHSTGGWSDVGLQLSQSLDRELDATLSKVSTQLTAAIVEIAAVQTTLDAVLGKAGAGPENATALLLREHESARGPLAFLADGSDFPPIDSNETLAVVRTLANGSFEGTKRGFEDLMKKLPKDLPLPDVVALVWAMAKKLVSKYMPSKEQLKYAINTAVEVMVGHLVDFLKEKLESFWETLKPALLQVGTWLESFGETIQKALETFSTTIDLVQKMFDQVMSKAATVGEGEEQMVYDTFTLFDVSATGSISVQDLLDVSQLYGIDALQGDKAPALHSKYDENEDGELSNDEYVNLVNDPSIPGAMSTVLRSFAKKLSVIAGNVAAARMRDEVAGAVVEYFTLICAKNHTKVEWVSERLTNGSLPMAFTADILKNLAMDMDNPDKLTKQDVGKVVISEMYAQKPQYVEDSLELMSQPDFWESEGFAADEQPEVIERVSNWMTAAAKENKASAATKAALLQRFLPQALSLADVGSSSDVAALEVAFAAMPAKLRAVVNRRGAAYRAQNRRANARRLSSYYYGSKGAEHLKLTLLGGSPASTTAEDPLLKQAVNSGQPAVPATLEFAKFLSWNASSTASRFEKQCFTYMGTSSSTVDSFANKVQAMVKKIQTFLTTMEEYSTPEAINRTGGQIGDFADMAGDMISDTVSSNLESKIDELVSDKVPSSLMQKDIPGGIAAAKDHAVGFAGKAQDSLEKVMTLLKTLQSILPDVLKNLKDGRKEVSGVAKQLHSVFSVFSEKGPPIFEKVSALYSQLWVAYFILFGSITLMLLFYGLWASGWICAGDSSSSSASASSSAPAADYEPPATFCDRLGCCLSACNPCLSCKDTAMCFWSCALLLELIALVLFIVAVALCILSGVKAFLSSGCSQVYILGDNTICAGSLDTVRKFLTSFWASEGGDFAATCDKSTLLTCALIGEKLRNSTYNIMIGSVLASVLTFQMIIESAIMHERARWRRIMDSEGKGA